MWSNNADTKFLASLHIQQDTFFPRNTNSKIIGNFVENPRQIFTFSSNALYCIPFSRDSTQNEAQSQFNFFYFIQHSINLKMLTLIYHRTRFIAIKWRQSVVSLAPCLTTFATRRQNQLFVIYSCIKSIELCLSRINPINLEMNENPKSCFVWPTSRISLILRSWNFHLIWRFFHQNSRILIEINECNRIGKIRKSQNVPTSSFFISSIWIFFSRVRVVQVYLRPTSRCVCVCVSVFGHSGSPTSLLRPSTFALDLSVFSPCNAAHVILLFGDKQFCIYLLFFFLNRLFFSAQKNIGPRLTLRARVLHQI